MQIKAFIKHMFLQCIWQGQKKMTHWTHKIHPISQLIDKLWGGLLYLGKHDNYNGPALYYTLHYWNGKLVIVTTCSHWLHLRWSWWPPQVQPVTAKQSKWLLFHCSAWQSNFVLSYTVKQSMTDELGRFEPKRLLCTCWVHIIRHNASCY